ncbi:MAG: preQ(1) synthase [Puniceicoccales bacterium]|jgi:7-cyano-7-deazaguanine reductase|nr:preQ(1) synthase [Puniceicoccales bacterium]
MAGTRQDDLDALTILGQAKNKPSRKLETFPNHHVGRNYMVELRTEEFTSLCPATGQPDFGVVTIRYVPGARIVESKSLKLYLWSFRNEGCFQEHLVNVILEDLVLALEPVWMEVEGVFAARGGIRITVRAVHGDRSAGSSRPV